MHDDATIIGRCLAGEAEGYRVLVERHGPGVRAFLVRKLGNLERAEDAAQDAFVRAYRGLAGLRERDRFGSWVLGIAANVAWEMMREPRAIAGEIGPREERVKGEFDELAGMVESLESPYRETVLLRYWGGLTCVQVAEHLGVPVGTVTKRLSRAHAELRGRLTGGKEEVHELRRVP